MAASNNPVASRSPGSASDYCTRHTWEVPSERVLQQHHPLTDEPLWKFIRRRVVAPGSASDSFSDSVQWVHEHWHDFLEHLSWWELKFHFNRRGNSVVLKPKVDVVVVHPVGRFPEARIEEQWKEACFCSLGLRVLRDGPERSSSRSASLWQHYRGRKSA